MTKYLRKQLKRRKELFWLMVSKVSVYGQLALLFLGYGEAEHLGEGGQKEGGNVGADMSIGKEDHWGPSWRRFPHT
jgi:hypothetical protein